MTRYPPSGQSPEGYGYPPASQYQERENQGYNQQYQQNYQQNYGYADNRGQADSYYAPPYDQANQHYQHDRPPPNDRYYQDQTPPHPPPQTYGELSYGNHGYGSPPPQQYGAGQYGGSPPPPQQSHPGYGEVYSQQNYIHPPGGEVDAFKSQFDQPHVAPSQYGQYPPAGAEGDRGLMGALAGGAAGAYGGHKMGHGIIGGLGGAVAGSMLEDAYKKHSKKDKKEKKHKNHSRRSSSSSSSSSDSDSSHKGHGVMAGNFHASSRGVSLEGHYMLVAECSDVNGHHRRSQLDLNQCLTNTDGRLLWARGGNFAASARHIRLTDGGSALEAELGNGHGGWDHSKIWLDERITNNDGRLEFLG